MVFFFLLKQKGAKSADEKEILLCSMNPAGALTDLRGYV